MSAVPAQRQTLTIVSGFLGSGKTTWLRHQLHAGEFRGAVVLVNEAAAAPVDDALLADLARVIVLPGGCACCERQAELVALLRQISDERSRTDSRARRFERIVLETSGLADPGPIGTLTTQNRPLTSVLLTAFFRINADNTYTTIDVTPPGTTLTIG